MKLQNSVKLFIASALIMNVAQLAFAHPEVRALQKDVPQEVAALIHRIVECNYWAGEEPYDKKRAAHIQRAVKKLRCDQLDRDEQRLQRKYGSKPKVLKALADAKAL